MYSGISEPSQWVLPKVLAEQGARRGGATWITMTDGRSITFGAAAADAATVAGHLASLGVKPGDMVAVMLPNGIDFVQVWQGIGRLGAVAVLLNTELRGAFLEHQLRNCGADLAIVDAGFLNVVLKAGAQVESLRRVAVVGQFAPDLATGKALLDWADWRTASAFNGPMPQAEDIACIMYTSGTSGPSKGVLMPHAHCTLYGIGQIRAVGLGADDIYYITLPLFHANGLLMQLGSTLLMGIPAVVRVRFSASEWLNDIRRFGCTVSNCLGALAAFVLAQPPRPEDRQHRLRALCNAPNLIEHDAAFRQRFGVRDVLSAFGMTEVNIPVWGRIGQPCPGAAGWVYDDHFEVIIADPETDRPVPPGELGEILVRPRTPFGFMAGYHGMPDRTVESWRNLWFHTGDAGICSSDGVITFVDRIKDCIRRRGENIAATEVESAVGRFEGIEEVAAFAVPSDIAGGEDELMLAIVPGPGKRLDPAAVAAFSDGVLPRFAAPRYIEIMESLPKTATGKVQRASLRKRGPGGAWDRQQTRKT